MSIWLAKLLYHNEVPLKSNITKLLPKDFESDSTNIIIAPTYVKMLSIIYNTFVEQ